MSGTSHFGRLDPEFARLDREAEHLFSDYVRAGDALAQIRNDRLYEPQWATFSDYLQARFGIHSSTGTSYVQASDVAHDLEATGIRLPMRHARLLFRFDQNTRRRLAATIAPLTYREAQRHVIERLPRDPKRGGRRPKHDQDEVRGVIDQIITSALKLDPSKVLLLNLPDGEKRKLRNDLQRVCRRLDGCARMLRSSAQG